MNEKELISCFELEKLTYRENLKASLEALISIPGTFTGLAWQFDYDFLYMSPAVSTLLGYPIQNFSNNGVLFLHSITPPEQIEPLYNKLNGQLREMEKEQGYIAETTLITAETELNTQDGKTVSTIFNALPIDYRPGDKNAYLVLGTNFLTANKRPSEVNDTQREIVRLMKRIKSYYVKSNPDRFRYLEALTLVTKREADVARLLGQGLNTKEIAAMLSISYNTVDTHRKNLLAKFKAKNTAELINQLSPPIVTRK